MIVSFNKESIYQNNIIKLSSHNCRSQRQTQLKIKGDWTVSEDPGRKIANSIHKEKVNLMLVIVPIVHHMTDISRRKKYLINMYKRLIKVIETVTKQYCINF